MLILGSFACVRSTKKCKIVTFIERNTRLCLFLSRKFNLFIADSSINDGLAQKVLDTTKKTGFNLLENIWVNGFTSALFLGDKKYVYSIIQRGMNAKFLYLEDLFLAGLSFFVRKRLTSLWLFCLI